MASRHPIDCWGVDAGEAGSSAALSPAHRHVLSCLNDCGGTASLTELAQRISARQADVSPNDVPAAITRRRYVALYDLVTDELADRGLVSYCQENGTVTLN